MRPAHGGWGGVLVTKTVSLTQRAVWRARAVSWRPRRSVRGEGEVGVGGAARRVWGRRGEGAGALLARIIKALRGGAAFRSDSLAKVGLRESADEAVNAETAHNLVAEA